MKKIESWIPEIEKHLEKIKQRPDDLAVKHWKDETRNWIRQIEELLRHVGKKQPQNGKPVSMPTKPNSKRKTRLKASETLKKRLADIYDHYQQHPDKNVNELWRHWFVFHMTDWIDDLERLYQFYKNPDAFDDDAANDAVFGFVVHAINHLTAASRHLDYTPDDLFKELEEEETKKVLTRRRKKT